MKYIQYSESKKFPILILDFVIQDSICNLMCDYCYSLEKIKNKKKQQRNASSILKGASQVLEITREFVNTSILKISGGEVFLLKGFLEFLEREAPFYEHLQVQTNGILLNQRVISQLEQIPNLFIQMTLDGHTLHANSYRVKSSELHDKLIENLRILMTSNIHLELNCCITKRNINELEEYLSFLHDLGGSLTLFPIPVRAQARRDLFPEREQSIILQRIVQDYDKYKAILPPKIYMEKMVEFILKGKMSKKGACRVPLGVLGISDCGIISSCALLGAEDYLVVGNLLLENPQDVFARIGVCRSQRLLIYGHPRALVCQQDLTQYELINMCINGEISVKELTQNPVFSCNDIEYKLKMIEMWTRQIIV